MVDPKKLLLCAATLNARGGHASQVQLKLLSDEKKRKEAIRRNSEHVVRKPEFSVPELEKMCAEHS